MSRQSGVGLVEVMISLVISMVVLIALGYFFVGGRQMNRTHDDVSRMQENGRYAMELIGKAVRQAGYRLDVSQTLSGQPLSGATGTGTAADTITLRHDPAWAWDKDDKLKGKEINCAGNLIESDNTVDPKTGARPVNTKLIEYVFSVEDGQLKCSTKDNSGNDTSALVASNIENMRVTYGMDENGDGHIDSYKDASGVSDFSKAKAVNVSLLLKGSSADKAANATQKYIFNGAESTSTDGYLRQVYTSTFALRN